MNQYRITSNPAEALGYDLDGNLYPGQQFVYTWDGENRLIEVQTRIDVGGCTLRSGDKHVVDLRTITWADACTSGYSNRYGNIWAGKPADELFVYDGWNVVMVLDVNASNAITRKYTWGLDLSRHDPRCRRDRRVAGACVETQGTTSEGTSVLVLLRCQWQRRPSARCHGHGEHHRRGQVRVRSLRES